MTWLECAACGHVYTDGYYTAEALAIVFARTHDQQKVGFDIENQRRISARIVDTVLPYAEQGHWLDVGFGNASLLFTAEEYGFIPVGVDLRRDNVEALRRTGCEAHCVDLADLDQPSRFSVVSMCDVLEHMPYPRAGLAAAHKVLDAKGVLLLSMPNRDSALWQFMNSQNANPYWGEMEHYHNFGRRRLYRLLRDNGFEPLRYGISERYRACMEVIARKTG